MLSKKILFQLTLLLLLINLESCNKCGDDTCFGDYNFPEEYLKNWIPYQQGQKLVFKNSKGDVKTFTQTQYYRIYRQRPFRTSCDGGKGDQSFDYFNGDELKIEFSDDNGTKIVIFSSIESSLGIENLSYYSSSRLITDNSQIDIKAITEQSKYDTLKISYGKPKFTKDITLANNPYKDVYYNKEKLGIYLKKGKGIIGYYANGEQWALKE